jgi:hypothetical protein
MNFTDSIHLFHYSTVAFGFIWLYMLGVFKASMLEDFSPYDHIRCSKLADLTGDDYKGFKKVVLAINYEHWKRVIDPLVSFRSIGVWVLVYLVLILLCVMTGRLATLKDLSVSIVPVVVSGSVSYLVLHLKSLEQQIKKP